MNHKTVKLIIEKAGDAVQVVGGSGESLERFDNIRKCLEYCVKNDLLVTGFTYGRESLDKNLLERFAKLGRSKHCEKVRFAVDLAKFIFDASISRVLYQILLDKGIKPKKE